MSKKVFVIIGIILVSLTLGGLLWYKIKHKNPPPVYSEDTLKQIEALDYKALENVKESTPFQLFGAMTRLGAKKEKKVLEIAQSLEDHTDALVRQGVAHVYAFHTDDPIVKEGLLRLMKDGNSEVQSKAVEAYVSSREDFQEKISKLENFLKNEKLSEELKFSVHLALLKLRASGSKENESSIKFLVSAFEKIQSTPQGVALINRLMVLAPRDPGVIEAVKKYGLSSSDPFLVSLSLRHLANVDKDFVVKRIENLVFHSKSEVRMSALQAFSILCPSSRWTLLQKILETDRDKIVVQRALQMAGNLGGPQAEKLLSSATSTIELDENNKKLAAEQLEKVRKEKLSVDRCEL